MNRKPTKSEVDAFNGLMLYTLSHPDSDYFIHQLVVDAYGAQHLGKDSKKIQVGATLLGLYWFCKLHFTGKQIQQEHMRLGKKMEELKISSFPKEKAEITVEDVIAVKAGNERDEKIKAWAFCVWESWKNEHQAIRDFYQTIK